jgi:hypothetical protein
MERDQRHGVEKFKQHTAKRQQTAGFRRKTANIRHETTNKRQRSELSEGEQRRQRDTQYHEHDLFLHLSPFLANSYLITLLPKNARSQSVIYKREQEGVTKGGKSTTQRE